jgi:5S rRNA maturation endonuclease (ribonuclease M5)
MTTNTPPSTMDGLLALSKGEALEIEALCWRGDLSIKRVTKHMVRVLADEMTWDGRENSQSLRGVWYSGVKQVYQHLFPEKWADDHYTEPPSRRFSQSLSEYTSELVKEGELTYRDINVVDDSRDREILGTDAVEHDKILFVEKRAKYRQLAPISDVLEVSLVSGGGWQATALIEDLANVLDPTNTYTIFILTDFDPTGYRIAEDFQSRAETLGVNVEGVERIGIEPEQVTTEVAEAERFEVPVESDYDERWLDTHGIEDDHDDPRYGLELEAIGGRDSAAQDFRRVVVEALDPHLRKRRRRSRDLNIETANVVGRGVDDLVDDMTEQLTAALKEYAIAELRDHDAVERLTYRRGDDTVTAAVDLAEREGGDDDRIPHPLAWGTYSSAAIDPDTTESGDIVSPRPPRDEQVRRLQRQLAAEMDDPDGDIDVTDLLDLDV